MGIARITRHLLTDHSAVRKALPAAALKEIERAITEQEKRHDGEIRFCIEAALPWSYLKRGAGARERAVMLFSKLRTWDTERNTGVLVYVLWADKAVEIVADRGIARLVEQPVWDGVCREIAKAFGAGQAVEGVVAGIGHISDELARHFPPLADNPDELANAPVVL
jgi:uncharacterized membrane protein